MPPESNALPLGHPAKFGNSILRISRILILRASQRLRAGYKLRISSNRVWVSIQAEKRYDWCMLCRIHSSKLSQSSCNNCSENQNYFVISSLWKPTINPADRIRNNFRNRQERISEKASYNRKIQHFLSWLIDTIDRA